MDIKRFSVFAVLLSSSSFSGAAEEESQRSSPYNRWAEKQTTNVGGSIPIRIVSQGQLRYAPSLEIEQGSGLVKSGGYVVNEEGVALSANSVRTSLAGETSGQPPSVIIGFNESTSQNVLLTGNVIVKYSIGFDPELLPSQFPLKTMQSFPSLNTTFYQILEPSQLVSIADSIARYPGVIYSTLEEINTGKSTR